MKVAMSKTREQFPLSVKKPLKKTMSAIIILLVAFVLMFIARLLAIHFLKWPFNLFFSSVLSPHLLFIVYIYIGISFLVCCFLIYIYQIWYYRVYFYDLTDDFIIIRKGVFAPKEITIPYERIQDVYVDQDLLDRIFGLYDVHVSTATISSGQEAHIDGVEKAAADGLRELILRKVKEKIKRAKGE